MFSFVKFLLSSVLILAGFTGAVFGQNAREGFRAEVDAVVAEAYLAAAADFPCKTKTRGKGKIIRWQDVEKCVNYAHDRVDWEALAARIQAAGEESGLGSADIEAVIEASLTAHAIPFNKIYRVKDGKALVPLSNSLLKFLPPGSLLNLPVYNQKGELLGSFSGVYVFERSGGLSTATSYRMPNFQYKDLHGEVQAPSERFLIDLYGVSWKEAESQPGFRLPADRLIPKR
ncbi:MAG: hypothetical protein JXP48_00985 [Acidobacteria bacterium]|nr:hypothetical protein [Acidobacteriota bacterium]